MSATASGEGHDEQLLRVQELQARLDSAGDPATREVAEELVSAVVQLYGAGLERIVGSLIEAGEEGERRLALALAEDPLVVALLLIHDLHPVPLEDRVLGALEHVRPYMESHGGNVELLSLQDGVARISLRGSCSDCAASAVTLELAIKQALEEAAPDLEELQVEGVAPTTVGPSLPMAGASSTRGSSDGSIASASSAGPIAPALSAGASASASPAGSIAPALSAGASASASPASSIAPESSSGVIELPMAMSPAAGPPATPSWFEVDHLDLVPVGQLVGAEVGGAALVVANVDGTLLAYTNTCADCGGPLDGGELQAGVLACPRCARTFFLPRAGRSMDGERLQLEPVPLLREQGHVKVALTP
jgi:Fe-S cluster biogenesis protein NfuA/nitrite reductase/ring-hydroxylating ferredoxin subunit